MFQNSAKYSKVNFRIKSQWLRNTERARAGWLEASMDLNWPVSFQLGVGKELREGKREGGGRLKGRKRKGKEGKGRAWKKGKDYDAWGRQGLDSQRMTTHARTHIHIHRTISASNSHNLTDASPLPSKKTVSIQTFQPCAAAFHPQQNILHKINNHCKIRPRGSHSIPWAIEYYYKRELQEGIYEYNKPEPNRIEIWEYLKIFGISSRLIS